MKAILISIRPQHALNILNGDKTRELRKSVPKDFVGWVYMYVTLGKKHEALIDFSTFAFVKEDNRFHFVNLKNSTPLLQFRPILNGKVVARWWHDEYETYIPSFDYEQYEREIANILDGAMVSLDGFEEYYGDSKKIYLWHIKKLEILEPMELGDFKKSKDDKGAFTWALDYGPRYISLTKAPSTYQYVYVKEK